jgi:glycosyltransferase involved in cell wall biosynthesis
MLKIAYLYNLDASSPAVQSGRPASILRQLQALGNQIVPVFPLEARPSNGSTVKKAIYRAFGRYYRGDRDPHYLLAMAAEFGRRTRGQAFDLVFSPGSEAVSHLDVPQPVTFCADATFANMLDYYWDFSSLSEDYVRKGHEQESNALRRAALAVYPSSWAARSAVDVYGADPAKVAVIPFGANLGATNRRDQVNRWISGRRFETIRLLFVGKAWTRKGGNIVVETAKRLMARGFLVNLDVVSSEMPPEFGLLPWVTHHVYLDPNLPGPAAVLADLFKGAHFLFIPSRAEAYGLAFAEASAFGLPSVGTDTGGIPSVVTTGINGFTLPLSAGAPDFADRIGSLFSNREQYDLICRKSFDEFERRLNWKTFCERFLEVAQQACPQVSHPTEGIA